MAAPPGLYWSAAMLVLLFLTTVHPASSEDVPKFLEEPESVVVRHNTEAVLRCRASPETATIRWKYNGNYITVNQADGLLAVGGTLHVRNFKHVQKHKHKSGVYQCVANNSMGAIISREATVDRTSIGRFRDEADEVINATRGNVAYVPCQPPHADPPPVISFEVNGTIIDETSSRHVILPSGTLQIGDVRLSDQGVYQCIAMNPVTRQRRTSPKKVLLHIVVPVTNNPPHVVLNSEQSYEVIEGEDLVLECIIEGSPVPVVSWNKYGGQLPANRYHQKLGNLFIRNAQIHDRGTYICFGDNGVGPRKSAIAIVNILQRPKILKSPDNKVVRVGETVTFRCEARGEPEVTREWLHNGRNVFSDSFIAFSDSTLSISNTQEHHAGIYQCVARSPIGTAYAAAHLTVLTANQNKPAETGPTGTSSANHNPSAGETGELDEDDVHRNIEDGDHPSVSTRPPDSVAKVVTPSAPIDRNVDLVHRNTTRLNQGSTSPDFGADRTSRPGNRRRKGKKNRRKKGKKNGRKRGRTEVTDTGQVTGDADSENVKLIPPSKPRVSKLSDTSVKLEWEVPSNPGLPITFFKVQYKEISLDRKRREWKTIDEDLMDSVRRYEVAGLHPGSTYRFRVVAVYSNNDNKHGQNSDRFTMEIDHGHKPQPPVAGPVIVEVRPLRRNELFIRWQYLKVNQSPIEGFFVYYKPYGSPEQFEKKPVIGPNVRQCTLGKLKPETEYAIKMQSFNSAGKSEFSNVAVKRTLSADGSDTSDEMFADLGKNPMFSPPPSTKSSGNEDDYDEVALSTQKSSEMLYMVLGIVLGVMILLLVVFMFMCAWRQRQQRRMMALMGENMRKFQDPARSIHNDSMRSKYTNGFLLNGLNGNVGNGHIKNYPYNGNCNGHSGMNININPLEMTQLNEPKPPQENMSNGHISQQPLPPPPPPPPLQCGQGPCDCNTLERELNTRNMECHSSTDNMNEVEETSFSSNANNHSDVYCEPPDYPVLSQRQLPLHNSFNSYRGSHDQLPYQRSHDPLPASCRTPSGSCQSSRERLSQRSSDYSNRSRDQIHRSRDRLSSNERDSHDSASQVANKSKRRRRKHHPSRDPCLRDVKDQATNTDMSSNEGTLDQQSLTYQSIDRLGNIQTHLMDNNYTNNLDYPQMHPNGHADFAERDIFMDIPRVHDYPPMEE